MSTTLLDPWSLIFLLLFLFAGIASASFLLFSRNDRRKEQLRPPLAFVTVLFFILYLYFPEGPVDGLWFILPASALITVLYLLWRKRTKK